MPVLHPARTALGLCLGLGLSTPVFADDLPVTSALRLLLVTMPDAQDAPAGSYQIDFGDVRAARALLQATGNLPLDPEDGDLTALMRGGTQIFARSASADETAFVAANGFGFADVDTNMQYARPPLWLNVLSLGFGVGDGVSEGLPEVGFTQEDRHGVSVFWRGDQDNAVMQPTPTDDLYGGALRRSVRLALAGDMMAFSSSWGVLETALTDTLPRMSDAAEVVALLDAIDASAAADERLILANLFIDVLPADYPGNLFLADLFNTEGHVTLAAYLPTDTVPVEDQAARLHANWSGLPISGNGGSFADLLGADVSVQVVDAGQPVIVMRLNTPFNTEVNRLLLNRGFGAVQSALFRGDLERLLSEMP